MAKIDNSDIIEKGNIIPELNNIGVNLEAFASINIVGQAAIAATALLAGANKNNIENDTYENPYIVLNKNNRVSLAAVYYYIDENNQIWISLFERNNNELQNDTGLKKYDLHLAAKGFGLSSAPFKLSESDSKLEIQDLYIGNYCAVEITDGSDDYKNITMPIVCMKVETKPNNAILLDDIEDEVSTSKVIAAKKSILENSN